MYMAVFLIILSCLLWAASIRMLMGRQGIAPVLSWLGLGAISLASRDGYHILPVNGTILTAWLCMTVVVTLVSYLQPEAVRRQTRGMGYIAGGALAGMAVGLLACSFTTSIGILYTSMISGTVAGIFFGFLESLGLVITLCPSVGECQDQEDKLQALKNGFCPMFAPNSISLAKTRVITMP